jgi:hypothetical protein
VLDDKQSPFISKTVRSSVIFACLRSLFVVTTKTLFLSPQLFHLHEASLAEGAEGVSKGSHSRHTRLRHRNAINEQSLCSYLAETHTHTPRDTTDHTNSPDIPFAFTHHHKKGTLWVWRLDTEGQKEG